MQQALIDLHYDLGPTGADGDYGNHTWDSVKRFKADQKLGWETMGDVGPGTMHRLDELFPATEPADVPPPKFAEEETQSCPTDDQIETAIQARPQNVLSLQESGPAATPARTPSASPPAHVSIPEAVRRFKTR